MKRFVGTIAAVVLLGCASAYAEETKVDTKAPGTEATEAMSKEVPTMKQADASDCVESSGSSTGK